MTEMNDLVSIIITTYNGKESVVRAVESCLSQTYPAIEVIVVDDSGLGTEGQKKTEALLAPFIESEKIQYIPHETNRNASVARNTGFRASRGKYISLLDDDDIYFEEKVARQVAALEESGEAYGVVYCGIAHHIENKSPELVEVKGEGRVLYEFLMMEVFACTSNVMLRREVFDTLGGFDESFARHQDWEFLTRAAAATEFLSIPYVGIQKNSQDIHRRFSAERSETYRLYFIEKMKPYIETLTKKQQKCVYGKTYIELAKLFFREKNFGRAWHYIMKSGKAHWFFRDLALKPFRSLKRKDCK